MTSLTAIFGHSRDDTSESEKLLELYWNRAELKREFADLRNETFRLGEQIKEQKGQTARFEQKLTQLEDLLLDPDWVYSVTVSYQLKALNGRLTRRLARFAENLKQQREQRVNSRQLRDWSSQRDTDIAGIDRQLEALRVQQEDVEARLQSERQRLSRRPRLPAFFWRRHTTRVLDDLAGQSNDIQSNIVSLKENRASLEGRGEPDAPGLDLQSKRSINFMILAYAQLLFVNYRDHEIAVLAKEAGAKSVGSIKYGAMPECFALLQKIERYRNHKIQLSSVGDELQQRAQLIAEQARFKHQGDAVPIAASVIVLFEIDENGGVSTSIANLLGENFWNLRSVLSH